ncbi:hypothetical protein F4804DRAFT_353087 [Jackrogersella minutella]|nr:hypothetical protein F4804DRAFT_353087 [Jackrogersella minutella]
MSEHGKYIPPFRRNPDAEPEAMPNDYISPFERSNRNLFNNNRVGRGHRSGRRPYTIRGIGNHGEVATAGEPLSGTRGNIGGGIDREAASGYEAAGNQDVANNGDGGNSVANMEAKKKEQLEKKKILDTAPVYRELYHFDEVVEYFCSSTEVYNIEEDLITTFHDSQTHKEQLAFVMIFDLANPRWGSEQVVESSMLSQDVAALGPHLTTGLTIADDDGVTKADQKVSGTQHVVSDSTSAVAATPSGGTNDSSAPIGEDMMRMWGNVGDIRKLSAQEFARLEQRMANKKTRAQLEKLGLPVFDSIRPIEYTPGPHDPIAAFKERHFAGLPSRFQFIGWHKVARVQILFPYSAELVYMHSQHIEQSRKLEQKEKLSSSEVVGGKTLSDVDWDQILSQEWAVVTFAKLPPFEAQPAPIIEKSWGTLTIPHKPSRRRHAARVQATSKTGAEDVPENQRGGVAADETRRPMALQHSDPQPQCTGDPQNKDGDAHPEMKSGTSDDPLGIYDA